MTTPNTQDTFDQWAATYDADVIQDGCFPFDGYDRVLQRILDLAHFRPGMAVLELGVGTGNLTKLMSDLGADVWGVDFSPEMLALAQEKVPNAHLAQADLLGAHEHLSSCGLVVAFQSVLRQPFSGELGVFSQRHGRTHIGQLSWPPTHHADT